MPYEGSPLAHELDAAGVPHWRARLTDARVLDDDERAAGDFRQGKHPHRNWDQAWEAITAEHATLTPEKETLA